MSMSVTLALLALWAFGAGIIFGREVGYDSRFSESLRNTRRDWLRKAVIAATWPAWGLGCVVAGLVLLLLYRLSDLLDRKP